MRESADLKRALNLFDASMINVGTMIGSGIFFVPAVIMAHLGSSLPYMGVWIVGGIVSLFGALAIAELGAVMPRAGGLYVYLKEIYGPIWGFLYGWTSLSVINSASIAAIAVAFATYLGEFIRLTGIGIQITAVLAIWTLTGFNLRGVKTGAGIQNGLGILKLGGLLLLVVLAVTISGGSTANFTPLLPEGTGGMAAALGLAMIAVLWSYDGWIEVTYTAGEVKNPERTLPRAILLSTGLVIFTYGLTNLAYLYLLGPGGITSSERVAADAARVVAGSPGAWVLAFVVMGSTLGACNGFILGASRIYYAMARDNLFFSIFAHTHPRKKTPDISLLVQAAWSSLLVFSGTFDQLITWMVFASWLFYILCAGGLFVHRARFPNQRRPYRAWGYPWTVIVFLIFAFALVLNAILEAPVNSLIGLGLIVSGLPVYARVRRSMNGR